MTNFEIVKSNNKDFAITTEPAKCCKCKEEFKQLSTIHSTALGYMCEECYSEED